MPSDRKGKDKKKILQELETARKLLAAYKELEEERSKVQHALKESEQRFRNIIEASPMGIHMYVLDKKGRLIFQGANPSADRILGVDNSLFVGKTIESAFPASVEAGLPRKYREVAEKGIPWQTEQYIYQDDQISGAFEVYAFQTQKGSMAAMFRDITDRILAEKALRFTQFSIDRTSEPAFWMGKDARLKYVNEAACRSLGYTKQELLSMTVHDIDPGFPQKIWPDHWQEVKTKGSFTVESQHKTKAGRIFPVEITVNYLEFEGNEYNCAFARDISQRKQAEQALINSEEQYRQLVQHSNDAIYLLYKRKFILINEQFKKMLNVTEEYLNRPDFDFMELIAPHSRPLIEERNQRMKQGESLSPRYTFTALSRDGREIEVEASVSYIKYKDEMATQGIIRDLSERKKLEEKLRQAHKMEALGTLAGGIAHNFNNILMGIQGRTSLMLMHKDSNSPEHEHLKGIEEYVLSAAELTKQLLGFARGGKYEVTPLYINQLLKKSAKMFSSTKKEVEIEENFQKGIWSTEIDIGQMEQVFLNLFVNAWQAMPGGGKLIIQTNNIRLSDKESKLLGKKMGRYVKITITDTGMGMDAATTERIFDPFFTTKEIGRGTGLGLATVYGILQNHDGFITVESKRGTGTTFKLFLPASRKKPRTKSITATETKKGKETILIVDDEEMILEVTSSMLQQAGYQIIIARNGPEALNIYKKRGNNIQLVILDMVMPEMGGGKTYDLLKELAPHIKVLLSSGYSMNEQATQILQRGCNGFIQKPFNSKELTTKIRKILDS